MRTYIEHICDRTVTKNIETMSRMRKTARHILEQNGYEEIDVPVLVPKGGELYNPYFELNVEGTDASLADSPQLMKTILSMCGYSRNYRFSHCFRPIKAESEQEGRMCEFTQLDIETDEHTLFELEEFAKLLITEMLHANGKKTNIIRIDGSECRRIYGDEMKPVFKGSDDEVIVVIIERLPLADKDTACDRAVPFHHIFARPTFPHVGTADANLKDITTESFDIIIDGIEVGGGDLRICDKKLQMEMMDMFHVDKTRYTDYLELLDKNGEALCGGFAIGMERLVSVITGSGNIRNALAFPDLYKRGSY